MPHNDKAFHSDDSDVQARAEDSIEVGEEGGGICYGCVFYRAPNICLGYGGTLNINPEKIVKSKGFLPDMPEEEEPTETASPSPINSALSNNGAY